MEQIDFKLGDLVVFKKAAIKNYPTIADNKKPHKIVTVFKNTVKFENKSVVPKGWIELYEGVKSTKNTDKNRQPIPKNGFEFTSWAVFNWGICLNLTFRTRKQAIEWCIENYSSKEKQEWKDVSKYMKVVKVKSIII